LQQTLGYEVDDNAVALVEYESGALGTIETGFLSTGSPFQLELYGTEGSLLMEDQTIRLKSRQLGHEWFTPKQLPEALPMAMEQWVQHILNEKEPTITEEDIIGLTLINQAASLSHKQGRRVEIAELVTHSQC
jgi:scyllo-inositol 2-dehydrogenase (NAD+)